MQDLTVCGIQFLLGHDSVTSTLLFQSVNYRGFPRNVVEIFSNEVFGYLLSYGLCCRETNQLQNWGWFGTGSDHCLYLCLCPGLLHLHPNLMQTLPGIFYQVGCISHSIENVQLSLEGLQVKGLRVWMECSLTGFLVWGARLVDTFCAASFTSWVKLLSMVDTQFS